MVLLSCHICCRKQVFRAAISALIHMKHVDYTNNRPPSAPRGKYTDMSTNYVVLISTPGVATPLFTIHYFGMYAPVEEQDAM